MREEENLVTFMPSPRSFRSRSVGSDAHVGNTRKLPPQHQRPYDPPEATKIFPSEPGLRVRVPPPLDDERPCALDERQHQTTTNGIRRLLFEASRTKRGVWYTTFPLARDRSFHPTPQVVASPRHPDGHIQSFKATPRPRQGVSQTAYRHPSWRRVSRRCSKSAKRGFGVARRVPG